MSYTSDMHQKMTGKTKGIYNGNKPTYSPIFGRLNPKQVIVLPDDWDFKTQPLFEQYKEKDKK